MATLGCIMLFYVLYIKGRKISKHQENIVFNGKTLKVEANI